MVPPVIVRAPTSSDFDAIARITNGEIAGGHAHFGLEPVGADELLGEWEAARHRYPWVVAERSGEVGGFAKAGPWKTRGAYAWTCETGVYVDPDHQGHGVGRALYERLFDELERAGFRTVLSGIVVPNDASVRLHESMGMERCALIPRNGYKHGAWRDVGYWVRHFGPRDGTAPAPTRIPTSAPPTSRD